MSNYITIGGLIEYADRLTVLLDGVFPNDFNYTSWEQSFGGAEFKMTTGYTENTGVEVVIFPKFYTTNDISIEIIADLSYKETSVIVIATSGYAKVATIISDYGGYAWIKNELIHITAAPVYNTVTGNWEITSFTRAEKGTHINNYTNTDSSVYNITSSPRTFAGLPVMIYDDLDQLLFSGKISEAPVLDGSTMSIKCRSDLDCLDFDITTEDDTYLEQSINFKQLFVFDTAYSADDIEFRGEIAFLPNMVFNRNDNDALSTLKIKDVGNFNTIMQMYNTLNQCFVVFEPVLVSNQWIPSYKFSSFNFNSIQNQADNEHLYINDTKDITKQVKFNSGSLVSKFTVKHNQRTYNFINPVATVIGGDSALSLDIPESLVRKKIGAGDSIQYETIEPGGLAKSFFRIFARVLQEIILPGDIRLSKNFYEVGKFYYLDDLDGFYSFVESGVSDLVFCYSITENETKFFHISEAFLYPIPPVYSGVTDGTVTISSVNDNNLIVGVGDISTKVVPISNQKYLEVGTKLKIYNMDALGGGLTWNRTVVSIGTNSIVVDSAIPATTDPVMIEYANKSLVSGDQLLWNYLT